MDANAKLEVKEAKWPNGNPQSRLEGYVNSEGQFVAHGVEIGWYDNGQKKYERHFVEGKLVGLRTTWFDDGRVRAIGTYVEGKPHGTWTEWFTNGNKSQEISYDHGAQHGLYVEWHFTGNKRREVNYVRGVPQLPERVWKEDGTEIFVVPDNKPEPGGH